MHIMLDLETMSTRPNAAIVTIGAAAFDDEGIHDRFYQRVLLRSSQEAGLHFDADTVTWWLEQPAGARAELTKREGATTLDVALLRLTGFIKHNPLDGVWGDGATFDNVITREAYRAVGQECPWKYQQDRCYRTMKNLVQMLKPENPNAHNALADAECQAEHLIRICQAVEIEL